MPFRPLTFREARRTLKAAGFVEQSQKGSHVKFVKQTAAGLVVAIVPQHREVAERTQRSICRQAGLSADDLEAL